MSVDASTSTPPKKSKQAESSPLEKYSGLCNSERTFVRRESPSLNPNSANSAREKSVTSGRSSAPDFPQGFALTETEDLLHRASLSFRERGYRDQTEGETTFPQVAPKPSALLKNKFDNSVELEKFDLLAASASPPRSKSGYSFSDSRGSDGPESLIDTSQSARSFSSADSSDGDFGKLRPKAADFDESGSVPLSPRKRCSGEIQRLTRPGESDFDLITHPNRRCTPGDNSPRCSSVVDSHNIPADGLLQGGLPTIEEAEENSSSGNGTTQNSGYSGIEYPAADLYPLGFSETEYRQNSLKSRNRLHSYGTMTTSMNVNPDRIVSESSLSENSCKSNFGLDAELQDRTSLSSSASYEKENKCASVTDIDGPTTSGLSTALLNNFENGTRTIQLNDTIDMKQKEATTRHNGEAIWLEPPTSADRVKDSDQESQRTLTSDSGTFPQHSASDPDKRKIGLSSSSIVNSGSLRGSPLWSEELGPNLDARKQASCGLVDRHNALVPRLPLSSSVQDTLERGFRKAAYKRETFPRISSNGGDANHMSSHESGRDISSISSVRDSAESRRSSLCASNRQVWSTHPTLGFVPWTVTSITQDGKLHLQLESGETSIVEANQAHPIHPSCLLGVPDLLDLGEFDLGPLLHNVRVRYLRNEIYTSVGPPILISVNPYKALPGLYSTDNAERYRRVARQSLRVPPQNPSNAEESLPPHPFAIAQRALTNVFEGDADQSVIISGESGAGKTEATKIILGYLAKEQTTAERSVRTRRFGTKPAGLESNANSRVMVSVERQIAQSNPLLEAFGNAKTIRNDNSSRFGKFTQVIFDRETRQLVGARISNYLLEKSRIITQQQNERNYHIFYQLCAGRSDLDSELADLLQLDDPERFTYLEQCSYVQGKDDSVEFQEILDCLRDVGFTEAEGNEIWKLLAGILHLGNVRFERVSEAEARCPNLSSNNTTPNISSAVKSGGGEVSGGGSNSLQVNLTRELCQSPGSSVVLGEVEILERKSFCRACTLFDIPEDELAKLLLYKTVVDAQTKEKILSRREFDSVIAARDSLCKSIYEKLFQWIVIKINSALAANFTSREVGSGANHRLHIRSSMSDKQKSIGLLDIFGFEIFEKNSFEQLCINFANEQLQQHFNSHVFREEQSLYVAEGIDWSRIDFEDNSRIIDALVQKTRGVFPLLDSECWMPRGTDSGFLSKMLAEAEKDAVNGAGTPPRRVILKPGSLHLSEKFGVAHYAGPVFYEVEGMLDKNRDRVHQDVIDYFEQNGSLLLRDLFRAPLNTASSLLMPGGRNTVTTRPGGSMTARRSGDGRNFTAGSVSYTFREQLHELMAVLGMTSAAYIRCIKPNGFKRPFVFESLDVLRQLKCAGMLESIRIRKAGYPIRHDLQPFLWRYNVLLFPEERLQLRSGDPIKFKMLAKNLLIRIETIARSTRRGKSSELQEWQLGRTKVFLKEQLQVVVEALASAALDRCSIIISRNWKGAVARRKYRLLRAMVLLQRCVRCRILQHHIQQWIRNRHRAATAIQRSWRNFHFRTIMARFRHAQQTIARAWKRASLRQRIPRLLCHARDYFERIGEDSNFTMETARSRTTCTTTEVGRHVLVDTSEYQIRTIPQITSVTLPKRQNGSSGRHSAKRQSLQVEMGYSPTLTPYTDQNGIFEEMVELRQLRRRQADIILSLRKEKEDLKKEKEILKREKEILKKEKETLKKEKETLELAFKRGDAANAEYLRELERNRTELDDKERIIESLEARDAARAQRFRDCKEELRILRARCQCSEEQKAQNLRDYEESPREILCSESQLNEMMKRIATLEARETAAAQANEDLRHSFEDSTRHWQDKYERLNRHWEDRYERRNRYWEDEYGRLKDKHRQLEDQDNRNRELISRLDVSAGTQEQNKEQDNLEHKATQDFKSAWNLAKRLVVTAGGIVEEAKKTVPENCELLKDIDKRTASLHKNVNSMKRSISNKKVKSRAADPESTQNFVNCCLELVEKLHTVTDNYNVRMYKEDLERLSVKFNALRKVIEPWRSPQAGNSTRYSQPTDNLSGSRTSRGYPPHDGYQGSLTQRGDGHLTWRGGPREIKTERVGRDHTLYEDSRLPKQQTNMNGNFHSNLGNRASHLRPPGDDILEISTSQYVPSSKRNLRESGFNPINRRIPDHPHYRTSQDGISKKNAGTIIGIHR